MPPDVLLTESETNNKESKINSIINKKENKETTTLNKENKETTTEKTVNKKTTTENKETKTENKETKTENKETKTENKDTKTENKETTTVNKKNKENKEQQRVNKNDSLPPLTLITPPPISGGDWWTCLSDKDIDTLMENVEAKAEGVTWKLKSMPARAFYDFRTGGTSKHEFLARVEDESYIPLHLCDHWIMGYTGVKQKSGVREVLVWDSAPSATVQTKMDAIAATLRWRLKWCPAAQQERYSEECGLFAVRAAVRWERGLPNEKIRISLKHAREACMRGEWAEVTRIFGEATGRGRGQEGKDEANAAAENLCYLYCASVIRNRIPGRARIPVDISSLRMQRAQLGFPARRQQDAAHALSRCGEVLVSSEEAAPQAAYFFRHARRGGRTLPEDGFIAGIKFLGEVGAHGAFAGHYVMCRARDEAVVGLYKNTGQKCQIPVWAAELDRRQAQLRLTIEQEAAGIKPSGPPRAVLEAEIKSLEEIQKGEEGRATTGPDKTKRAYSPPTYTPEEVDAMSPEELEQIATAVGLRARFKDGPPVYSGDVEEYLARGQKKKMSDPPLHPTYTQEELDAMSPEEAEQVIRAVRLRERYREGSPVMMSEEEVEAAVGGLRLGNKIRVQWKYQEDEENEGAEVKAWVGTVTRVRRKRISACFEVNEDEVYEGLVPDDGIQYFKIDTIDAEDEEDDGGPVSERKKDGPKNSTATTNIEAPEAAMVQTAAHQPKGPKVEGSNPGAPSFCDKDKRGTRGPPLFATKTRGIPIATRGIPITRKGIPITRKGIPITRRGMAG